MDIRHVDWLNANAYRRYPLVDGAQADVPNGLLVDLALPVPQDLISPYQLFVQKVVGFGQGVVVSLALTDSPQTSVAACTLFLSEHELNISLPLVGQGQLSGAIGRLTFGTFDALQVAAGLSYDFSGDPDSALLLPSTVRPSLRGISGLRVISQGLNLGTVSGAVTFQAGQNVSLGVNPETGTITINSSLTVQQSDLEDDCGCGGQSEPERPPIRSINGLLPDSEGNIQIVGSGLTDVTAGQGGLRIEDSSSTPCCECDQLDVLYQALQSVENELGQLLASETQTRSRIGTLTGAITNSAINQPPIVE